MREILELGMHGTLYVRIPMVREKGEGGGGLSRLALELANYPPAKGTVCTRTVDCTLLSYLMYLMIIYGESGRRRN